MAGRQQFLHSIPADPELKKLLEATKTTPVTEEELREQRISFAFGNAPHDSQGRITKESVRWASGTYKAAALEGWQPAACLSERETT